MSQPLPISNFEWVTVQPERIENILRSPDDSNVGYFLEVDLKYPRKIHDKHDDYPFCCQRKNVGDSKQKKLILDLEDKEHYVIHYHMLKIALKNGLKLKKVHNILQFKQSFWLKTYMDLNTKKRTESKNPFEKNLYKLMSNAIYGKCVENVRKRVEIKLVSHWRGRYGAKSLISKPNFKKRTIFNKSLVAIEMEKTNIVVNKPIIVGVAILEISKTLMYNFHYDFMLKEHGSEKCQLLYTDTDSFLYSIQDRNIYETMKKHPERFDTSDFATDNQFGIKLRNKKIPGLMKDENKGNIMSEFVGLRAKMYSIKVKEKAKFKVTKRAKGVKKHILSKKISFKNYVDCVMSNLVIKHIQPSIRSRLHKVYTINESKKVLDAQDNKRYIMPDNINTVAWGHYKLNGIQK